MKKIFLLLALTFAFGKAMAQVTGPIDEAKVDSIVFADTLGSIVTDFFVHNLGKIDHLPPRIVKYFKYIGKEPAVIVKTWTTDPHFICRYPNDPLLYGKIYAIVICFYDRPGSMRKQMGFNLSDGQAIRFEFKAEVLWPERKAEQPMSKD